MSDWREITGTQNLRLAQQMLEQQGEISDLKAKLAAADLARAALEAGIKATSDLNEVLMRQLDQVIAGLGKCHACGHDAGRHSVDWGCEDHTGTGHRCHCVNGPDVNTNHIRAILAGKAGT